MKLSIEDIMTKDVYVAHDDWTFKDVARHLRTIGVSALPVLDEADRLVGIVSEGDLMLKQEADGPRKAWLLASRRRRLERHKAEAVGVRDLMTSPVVTIRPDAAPAAAARLMHRHGIKRLPVVDEGGKVVGIVSRQDLVRIFLRPDDDIRHEVVHEIIERSLFVDPDTVRVVVEDGVVTLEGELETKSLVQILVDWARRLDGVVDVIARLSFERDDTRQRPETALPWGVLPPSMRYPGPRRSW